MVTCPGQCREAELCLLSQLKPCALLITQVDDKTPECCLAKPFALIVTRMVLWFSAAPLDLFPALFPIKQWTLRVLQQGRCTGQQAAEEQIWVQNDLGKEKCSAQITRLTAPSTAGMPRARRDQADPLPSWLCWQVLPFHYFMFCSAKQFMFI